MFNVILRTDKTGSENIAEYKTLADAQACVARYYAELHLQGENFYTVDGDSNAKFWVEDENGNGY
jgi:hypothetical protein